MSTRSESTDELPAHTISLRHCWQSCQEAATSSSQESLPKQWLEDRVDSMSRTRRHQAYARFWSASPPTVDIWNMDPTFRHDEKKTYTEPYLRLDVLQEKFQYYHHHNLPCLIQGLESCFETSHALWTRRAEPTQDPNVTSQEDTHYAICRDWFQQHCHQVPVRYQPQDSQAPSLDEQGRAQEPKTQYMDIHEWMALVQAPGNHEYYLKDWHLQLGHPDTPFYDIPPLFPHDLLNEYLITFTDGDYRFVYHGPPLSQTTIHSDVLNSFSWSYNVVGLKEWTFFRDDNDDNCPGKVPQSLVVRQRAGECMFVPAGWKHSVVNIQETISINHNWITYANVDLTLDCLRQEIRDIDTELAKWDTVVSDWEARENMLRGCTGLDISTLVLMTLWRLLALREDASDATERNHLVMLLHSVLHDSSLHLLNRLDSTLQSKEYARMCLELVQQQISLAGFVDSETRTEITELAVSNY